MPSPLTLSFTLHDYGIQDSFDRDRFATLCRFVLVQERQVGEWEVNLALVSDSDLRTLHARFMDDDTVTDVMTFPLDDPDLNGGDIVISDDRAADQGPIHGHTKSQEIDFLFVHGLLHLCGWDDRNEKDRQEMLARQSDLLSRFADSIG